MLDACREKKKSLSIAPKTPKIIQKMMCAWEWAINDSAPWQVDGRVFGLLLYLPLSLFFSLPPQEHRQLSSYQG